MSRGNLLVVAEGPIELVSRPRRRALVGDLVRLDELGQTKSGTAPLFDEVRKFQATSMGGECYESFGVNWKNFREKSEGTKAFIAEVDRLLGKCVRTAETGPRPPVREVFELLLAQLRRIDEDPDRVVFFADAGGSWLVGVDWRAALPAYFRCLAGGASGDDVAREVDRAITDFADDERPRHPTVARRIASAEQKASCRRLPAREGRR